MGCLSLIRGYITTLDGVYKNPLKGELATLRLYECGFTESLFKYQMPFHTMFHHVSQKQFKQANIPCSPLQKKKDNILGKVTVLSYFSLEVTMPEGTPVMLVELVNPIKSINKSCIPSASFVRQLSLS